MLPQVGWRRHMQGVGGTCHGFMHAAAGCPLPHIPRPSLHTHVDPASAPCSGGRGGAAAAAAVLLGAAEGRSAGWGAHHAGKLKPPVALQQPTRLATLSATAQPPPRLACACARWPAAWTTPWLWPGMAPSILSETAPWASWAAPASSRCAAAGLQAAGCAVAAGRGLAGPCAGGGQPTAGTRQEAWRQRWAPSLGLGPATSACLPVAPEPMLCPAVQGEHFAPRCASAWLVNSKADCGRRIQFLKVHLTGVNIM